MLLLDLRMLSLGNLVPEGPWCVFHATKCQVYWGLTHNVVFAGTLIRYHTHITHHVTHTHPVMCFLYYIE